MYLLRWMQVKKTTTLHRKCCSICKQRFQKKTKLRRQARSIGVSLPTIDTLTFDVVPAYATQPLAALSQYDGGFKIPDNSANRWTTTFPHKAKKAIRAAQSHNHRLIPLIRLLKQWNYGRARNTTKPLKSFHLEVMCYDVDLKACKNDRQNLRALIQHVADKLRNDKQCPVPAPGGQDPLSSYFDEPNRQWTRVQVQQWLDQMAELAKQAVEKEQATEQAAALALWKQIFEPTSKP